MNPHDTQTVVAGILVGQGKDRLSSVGALKFYDRLVQYAYDKNFDLPAPPPRPIVTASAYDRKVVLTWTNRPEVEYDEPTHDFVGYVVYQGESEAGPWTPIATFDKKDGRGMLKDFVLDQNLGDVVYEPVVYGSDAGLGYQIEITKDKIRSIGLHNGMDYYFGVTAYSYDFADGDAYVLDPIRADSLYVIPKGLWYLENRIQVITVTPSDDIPGTDWGTASAWVVQERYDSSLIPSTDQVFPVIVDPNKINGHTYQVRFRPVYPDTVIDSTVTPPDTSIIPPDTITIIGADTVPITHYWELWDLTANKQLLKRQINNTGDRTYEVFDGIQFFVSNQNLYINFNASHRVALEGHDWGGTYFGGGIGTGYDFWGGYLDPATMPDSFTTIELKFTGPGSHGQRAYNYLRGGGYAYQGYFWVPFEAWDVINNRQVNVCFVENIGNGSSALDSTWYPNSEADGGREYLLPLKSDYDGDDPSDAGTGSINYTTADFADGSAFDFLYGIWCQRRASSDVIDSGDVLRLYVNPTSANENDIYTIYTTSAVTESKTLAIPALDSIRVVPNPYYAFSIYEGDQFDRQVRFLGVPDEFTIKIFNIAGDMIRTLSSTDKTSGNSWMEWNLTTDQGSPVAGGIYIWYLEAPGIGTKHGKMAIFPEVEQLNTY
jgi:hypothetical protein